MQIVMIIVGILCIILSVSFVKNEIHNILYGISDKYERIKNELRTVPRKYGDDLTKSQKINQIILTVIIGGIAFCSGIAWIYFPVVSIINNLK